jgi:hypothetical protein
MRRITVIVAVGFALSILSSGPATSDPHQSLQPAYCTNDYEDRAVAGRLSRQVCWTTCMVETCFDQFGLQVSEETLWCDDYDEVDDCVYI